MNGRLAGVRVLVTRPAGQAHALARMIEAEGGVAILSPAIAIEPVADLGRVRADIGPVERFDVAVFVSPNAVAHGASLVGGASRSGLRIAAIGPSTARALEEAGLTVSIRPRAGYTSEALLAEPELQSLGGRRVLIVRGRGGRELLADTLAARGAEIVHAEVYQRTASGADASALIARWRSDGIDLATALSVDTLDALLRQLGPAAQQLLRNTPLVTASARVIQRAAALGLPDAVRADRPDDRGLLDAMITWAGGRRSLRVNESSGSTGAERGPPSSALDERVTRALARADATDQATADALRESEAGNSRVAAGDARARAFAGLALLVAVAGVGMGVLNYLRPNVKPPDLSSVQTAIGTAGTALEEARASMGRLDGQLADMRKRVNELASTQTASKGEVDTLRNQVMETAEAMQGLAVAESADSGRWMRAEAEHLMQAANVSLQLNHDAHTALVALEAADKRLAELDDPALIAARAKLTDEIAALRALQVPDLEGVALTLGSLAARVEMLPLAGASAAQASAPSAGAQSAWRRALDRIGAAFASMVSVRRTDATDGALLAPEERFFLYRNLELELESARLAALQGDAANYKQSLGSAHRWLETRFDRNDPGVQSSLDALAELEAVEFVKSWPDISGSLTELRRAAAE